MLMNVTKRRREKSAYEELVGGLLLQVTGRLVARLLGRLSRSETVH